MNFAPVRVGVESWPFQRRVRRGQTLLGRQAFAHATFADFDPRVDIGQFDRDVADPAVAASVERHIAAGRASGVRGTPTFFLNGQRQDEWDLPALRMAILATAGDPARDTT